MQVETSGQILAGRWSQENLLWGQTWVRRERRSGGCQQGVWPEQLEGWSCHLQRRGSYGRGRGSGREQLLSFVYNQFGGASQVSKWGVLSWQLEILVWNSGLEVSFRAIRIKDGI